MPLVDRGVVLDSRIGALPGGFGDLIPQVAGLDRAVNLAIGAADEIPIGVILDRLDEVVGDTD